jgi:hypothetical protein
MATAHGSHLPFNRLVSHLTATTRFISPSFAYFFSSCSPRRPLPPPPPPFLAACARHAGVLRGRGKIPVADYRLAATVKLDSWPEAQVATSTTATDTSSSTTPSTTASSNTATTTATSHTTSGSSSSSSSSSSREGGRESERGVYSFCMCPGGQIVPTSVDEGELCINGMSFSRRNSEWANSALVAGVGPADWAHLEAAHGPLAGMALQVEIER